MVMADMRRRYRHTKSRIAVRIRAPASNLT